MIVRFMCLTTCTTFVDFRCYILETVLPVLVNTPSVNSRRLIGLPQVDTAVEVALVL